MSFNSFSYLITLVRTSITVLNKIGRSGHLCLIPDLIGNTFSFSSFNAILVSDLLYMAFIMLIDLNPTGRDGGPQRGQGSLGFVRSRKSPGASSLQGCSELRRGGGL